MTEGEQIDRAATIGDIRREYSAYAGGGSAETDRECYIAWLEDRLAWLHLQDSPAVAAEAETRARNWETAATANRDAAMGYQDRALGAERLLAEAVAALRAAVPKICAACRDQVPSTRDNRRHHKAHGGYHACDAAAERAVLARIDAAGKGEG